MTPFYAAARPKRLLISGLPEDACRAYDGEVTEAPPALLLDKLDEALTVYRPAPDDPPAHSLAAPMDTLR